MQSIYYKPEA